MSPSVPPARFAGGSATGLSATDACDISLMPQLRYTQRIFQYGSKHWNNKYLFRPFSSLTTVLKSTIACSRWVCSGGEGTGSQPAGLIRCPKRRAPNALAHPYRRLDRCRPCRGSCSAGVFRSLNMGLRRDLCWRVRIYCRRNHLRRTS